MVIIEGPDGSGKSTLCTTLDSSGLVDKVLPSPRVAANRNQERMLYETKRYLSLYGNNNKIAIDRFLFSEMVYGPILRGKSSISRNEYLNFLLEICLSGSIVIFCMPNTLHYKDNENPAVKEKAAQIRKSYQNCAEDSAFSNQKTFIYRWDEEGSFKKLRKFIEVNR